MKYRIAVCFHRFGPYHRARLVSAASSLEVHAIELSQYTDVYAWDRIEVPENLHYSCVSKGLDSRVLDSGRLRYLVQNVLESISPDVVAINGWSDNGALAVLSWCLTHDVPAILMSDSNQFDEPRRPIREWVKRHVVRCFSSALVAGATARSYTSELGMPMERVSVGYDVVDNGHFDQVQCAGLAEPMELQRRLPPYFLASNRFVEKKNLPRLIQAFARYNKTCAVESESQAWDLVMLGDGPMRDELAAMVNQLGLGGKVHLAGFKQYGELPHYYWNAGAFIHASTTDQWGLVVNEAMASGLPVLVSNRCGCAADLVQDGVNGFTFDPTDVDQIARLMCKVAAPDFPRSEFGRASQRIIADWGPDRFAMGLKAAAEKAMEVGPKRSGLVDRLLLELLCRR